MSDRLAGDIAIVTGTSGGIGAAIARRFVSEGATVFGLDKVQPNTDDLIENVTYASVDVTDRSGIEAAINLILSKHSKIDCLVHAAAKLGGSGAVLDVTPEDWNSYIAVNLTGSFNMAQIVARAMKSNNIKGRIVLIGSVNSFAAEPGAAPYVASKGGVRMLSKALAVDLAPFGIAVNLIAPGPIIVPRNASLFKSEALKRSFKRNMPVGQAGSAEDIGSAAVFLAERGSGFMTGSELVIDGGLLSQILPEDIGLI